MAGAGVRVDAAYNRHSIEATPEVTPHHLDVTNPYLVAQFFDAIRGPVDYLILCHGITADALGTRMAAHHWNAVVDTNLTGTFYCLKGGVSRMEGGVVVVVSSVAVEEGIYGAANYAASKTGLKGLVRSFALENPAIRFELVEAAFHDAGMGSRLPPKVRARAEATYGPFSQPADFVSKVLALLGVQVAEV
ncbi:MAG: SDR family NAD(P)-dependent oxidoreductase [Thaumarchaeota archaeon]|nr:SDR family NAD(P)-dependent oxidoreductase [Nitrososphaerota archaeon]